MAERTTPPRAHGAPGRTPHSLPFVIVVLAGGMGAARFLRGVVRVVPPERVTVVGNTGDDIEVYGVHVSPDLDIVTSMLAGTLDEERGYGIRDDTRAVIDELRACGVDCWFDLGDLDLARCAARTAWLRAGVPLSEVTARLARRHGLGIALLPMTDDPVYTVIETDEGPMHFQEYWVRRHAEPAVRAVRLDGGERARPGRGVLDAIARAEAVLVAPSNPVVSIGTILAVPGIRDALRATAAPVVGVSPIVGGAVVRGMADRLLPAVGAEVSAAGVAALYRDFLDGWVIDLVDAALEPDVRALGVDVAVTNTMMREAEDAAALAKAALALAGAS